MGAAGPRYTYKNVIRQLLWLKAISCRYSHEPENDELPPLKKHHVGVKGLDGDVI